MKCKVCGKDKKIHTAYQWNQHQHMAEVFKVLAKYGKKKVY